MLFLFIVIAILALTLVAAVLAPASTDVADARVIVEADARVAAVHEHSLVCIREAYVNGYERGHEAGRRGFDSELAYIESDKSDGAHDDLAAYLLGQPVRESLADYHDYVAEKAMDAADHLAAVLHEAESSKLDMVVEPEQWCSACDTAWSRCDCIPF